MALIIKATAAKPILIDGTDVPIPSLYIRLGFACSPDGRQVQIGIFPYSSRALYDMNKLLTGTDLPCEPILLQLGADQIQSLELIHELCAGAYRSMGYDVTIDLNSK